MYSYVLKHEKIVVIITEVFWHIFGSNFWSSCDSQWV